MRDSYEFINFFKQDVFHEIADEYQDFLEDIKILRENHIMLKGHEKSQGKNYISIGRKLKKHIEQLQIIRLAF